MKIVKGLKPVRQYRGGFGMKLIAFLTLIGGLFGAGGYAVQAQEIATSNLISPLPDAKKERKWDGEWAFKIAGINKEEGKDEASAAALYLDLNFNYAYTEWFKARVSPRMNFFSGRSQERFDDDTLESRIWLSDAYVAFEPSEYFELRAGALNQRYQGSSMLISGLRSFPGIQEIIKWEKSDLKARLVLQQAVPTSNSLNTERVNEEKMPSFNTQTLAIEGKNFGLLNWKVRGGLFSWGNIPAKVVFESRRLGNEGTGDLPANNVFLYDHRGWIFSGDACLCFNDKFSLMLEFERIQNTAAPDYAADAQLWGAGPRVDFGSLILDLRYRNYFIESGATVAAYNKSRYGNTNRVGHNVEASLEFKNHGFALVAEAYLAKRIFLNADQTQRDLTFFLIGVETAYADF